MSLILGILDSGGAAVAAGSYESIATVTVGSGTAADITFSSIPATYAHLQIRGIGRGTASESDVKIQLNGDTGSNYAYHRLYGTGSTTGADGASSQTTMFYCGRLPTATSTFGADIVDILDYTITNKYTTVRALFGWDANGSGNMFFASGLWMNTNAVTSIKLIPHSGNFAEYSQFALYGIKGS